MNEDDIFLEVPRWVWPLAVLALVFTAWAALHIYLGGLVTLPVVAAATVAFGMWLATTYRRPRARRILPHFVALAILLMLQGLEQWSLGYSNVLVEMFPSHFVAPVMWSAGIQLVVFTLLSTTIFLFAGVGIFFHHPLGNYGAWLMMAFAVVGGIWHFLLPVLAGELRYVPGMGMASVVAAWGVFGILRLYRLSTPRGEVLS